MSQIKSSTLHGRHAKTLCPLNWTWSAERSSQMVAVVPAKHNSKMQSIHYSYAQPCGPCGVQWRSGIMARSRHAPLLLTYLILFLQVIRNWIYLLLWSGHYGTGKTTYTWASQHYPPIRWLSLPMNAWLSPSLVPDVFTLCTTPNSNLDYTRDTWFQDQLWWATFAEDEPVGIGAVIRNNVGLVMVSFTQQIPMIASVIEVEVLAAMRALELALELGFDNVILEGDSEILLKYLKSSGSNRYSLPYLPFLQD